MKHPKNKHERHTIKKHKLEKLYEETKGMCRAGAWDNGKRIIKYYVLPYYKKRLKKVCSKKTRKTNGIVNGCAYKKCYDYWCELF